MSLKHVHIVLISLAVLLSLVFAVHQWGLWSAGGGPAELALALVALALAAGLAVYVAWFARRMRPRAADDSRRPHPIRPPLALLVAGHLASSPALACAVCYGEARGPLIDAARLGVWLLFGLVFAVQLAFVLFFVHLWRRARACARVPPRSH